MGGVRWWVSRAVCGSPEEAGSAYLAADDGSDWVGRGGLVVHRDFERIDRRMWRLTG